MTGDTGDAGDTEDEPGNQMDGADGSDDGSDAGKNGSNGPGEESGDGDGDGSDEGVSTVEMAVILVSVLFTLLLFGYVGWQMVAAPSGTTPSVSVVGTEPVDNGSVAVEVELRNPRGVGLVTATVQADCSSPPPQVSFSYVPAASTRTGTLICPPGTTAPNVSLANWVIR